MPFIGNKPASVPLTSADITDGIIGIADLSATGTKDATTFLRGDNSFEAVPAGGITEADQWRLTTSFSDPDTDFITANLERNDSSGFGLLGTGMTQSSGVFTFPSTGYWLIHFILSVSTTGTDQDMGGSIYTTIDNSTYVQQGYIRSGGQDSQRADNGITSFLFDVTSTANCKVKFHNESIGAGTVVGNSTFNETHMTFLKLGDT